MLRVTAVIFVAVITLSQIAVAAEQVDADELFTRQTSREIAGLLQQRGQEPNRHMRVADLLTHEVLKPFYAARDYRPLWQNGPKLSPAVRILLEHLRGAAEHGLCSDAYLIDELDGLLRLYDSFYRHSLPLAPFNRALFDLFLTQAFLTYATHQVEGQIDPALTHVDWQARRRKVDLGMLLKNAIEKHRLPQALAGLMPQHEGYRCLMQALAEYRAIAAFGGWPLIPPGPSLRPGDTDRRLPVLRERLSVTGDMDDAPAAETDAVFTQTDLSAVKRFQQRHGLIADGIVGPRTLAALNVPVELRIRQLELNLERWRWLPKTLGERYIEVNIAAFSLSVMEGGQAVMSMPVVVGTEYRKTPVFSASMTYLEFAPAWFVPPTILREDKLPAIKADPEYLADRHYRILEHQDGKWIELDPSLINWPQVNPENFPGILRQDPGPWNPLGRVKFMFPNKFNVYLHDTDQPHLFQQARRSFSSGCIRVEQPMELAQYLLAGAEGWDKGRLLASMQSTDPVRIEIQPLPVHLQYWTAWCESVGTVHFRPDIYYRDLDLEVALSDSAYRLEKPLDLAESDRARKASDL